MREIKFRAWDTLFKKMYHNYAEFRNGDLEIGFTPDKTLELMQFTGLHDKNGKEIYEGDIVFGKFYLLGADKDNVNVNPPNNYEIYDPAKHSKGFYNIKNTPGCFWEGQKPEVVSFGEITTDAEMGDSKFLAWKYGYNSILTEEEEEEELEVIGNIYENPELLAK